MSTTREITVEVAFALPEQQWLRVLRLPLGSVVAAAIAASGIAELHPDLVIGPHNVGVFSRRVGLDRVLADGDRVEIYRPLIRDPKESRRLRAASQRRGARSKPA